MIYVKSINVDGREVTHDWRDIEDFKQDWFSDDFSGPSLDDPVVTAIVDDVDVDAESFHDVMNIIREHYGFDY